MFDLIAIERRQRAFFICTDHIGVGIFAEHVAFFGVTCCLVGIHVGRSGITGFLECPGELDRQIGMFVDYGLRERKDVDDRVDARLFGVADDFLAIIEELFDPGYLAIMGAVVPPPKRPR